MQKIYFSVKASAARHHPLFYYDYLLTKHHLQLTIFNLIINQPFKQTKNDV